MDRKVVGQTQVEINPDTAIATVLVTWEALTAALVEIAKMYPDDSWKPIMREKMLMLFEKGTITEEESGQGVMHPFIASHLKNFGPDAFKNGIEIVESALDRIVYQSKP